LLENCICSYGPKTVKQQEPEAVAWLEIQLPGLQFAMAAPNGIYGLEDSKTICYIYFYMTQKFIICSAYVL
jgi:hypothetical protein